MFDPELLSTLDGKDKEAFLSSISQLIRQIDTAHEEFKNLKDVFTQIIEFVPNAFWVLESDGELFLLNSEAQRLEGLFEKIDISKESDEIDFENNYYLIQTNKKLDKLIVSATNITDEKRKERLASMGQIAAHLAHEIRNPVGSVALLASTLLKRVDIRSKPLVYEIKKSIWRVERIVKATLLFSKGLSLNLSSFNLSTLEEELNLAISYYTFSKEIDFRFSLPSKDICADADLLSIVFQNFLFNSIDAIEEFDDIEEGVVEFFYEEDRSYHLFKIYDNGNPIENKDMLFEPFKTTKTKGNGLGLALSTQIVDVHNGSIEVLEEEKKGFLIKISKKL